MIEIRNIKDTFAEGVDAGWKTVHAGELRRDEILECDVVIVGTGAGGGTAAEILTQAGLDVVLIEEGPLRTTRDFRLDERSAYRDLYQEGAARTTKDGSMIILQGRNVGGSTTVNWTSSFRTPEQTLLHWESVHGIKGMQKEQMAPWFDRMEKRLHIGQWTMPANPNNDVIRRGCEQLGWSWESIPRNVNGCWNLGYCGLGCPTNAKQSMLVTTIPEALKRGARLYHRARAEKIIHDGKHATGVLCLGMRQDGVTSTGVTVTVRARHVLLAGGGINNPGLLLRSEVPDPYRTIGKRTMLHPVNAVFAHFDEKIEPWNGAPQSLYSDHFQWKDGPTGSMGFKIEAVPLQPGLASSLLGGHGEELVSQVQALANTNGLLALCRDGFTEDSPGGTVSLRSDGTATVDYPMTDTLRDGLRRGFLAMAELQFAAGAKEVRPHQLGQPWFTRWDAYKQAIQAMPIEKFQTRLGSAHVMGGCAMGSDPANAVADNNGRYMNLDRLSIMDGSLFPTSIGANPQLSIYGMVARLAAMLAAELKPLPVK
ncbi:MAG: GMC family oxidoreductase [Moraxellaceae bacterium]|jgi:choline dehydrogenase-like flavoprotein|nr:GMC family oxidoreductase [Moraxellaceae bacterium]MBP7230057.1 GMC family oxidoreductase [Moraxellaceae bacterium]MBP9044759.1 GMC family oxidoreductase [Moraxellaceae bacterium]MBP9730302.1 GMC family oxidoreductase [Moraxellaceae bacterium]HQV41054.1 GMC family oxidoreductase [Moraxellaceae bacterium]